MSPFNLHPACLLAGRSVGTLTRPFALRVTDAFVAGGIAVALRLSACGGSLSVTRVKGLRTIKDSVMLSDPDECRGSRSMSERGYPRRVAIPKMNPDYVSLVMTKDF